jgi:CheY-like chemotaxis protein
MVDDANAGYRGLDRSRLGDAIVHDLNNLLAAIAGCADQVATALPSRDPARHDIQEILSAVGEASLLVRLGNERAWEGPAVPGEVDVNDLLRVTGRLARKLVPRGVDVRTDLVERGEYIRGEPVAILRVLLGLAEWLAEDSAAGDAPSPWLALSVRLDGDAATIRVAAGPDGHCAGGHTVPEPIGTLAESTGALTGDGSVWELALRRSDVGLAPVPNPDVGLRRVLIAEPDDLLRSFLVSSLRAHRVEAARDGGELARIVDHNGDDIDLVLLSVDLPGVDVLAVFRRLRALDGNVGFVFIGGEEPVGRELRYLVGRDDRVILVQKPFGVAQLKRAIDDMTNENAQGGSEIGS